MDGLILKRIQIIIKNIKIYLNLFPKENLKILIYEEDLFDPDLPTFKDLFDHLNVDASFKPDGFQRTENRQMNTKVGLQLYNLSKIHFKPIAPLISAFDRLLPNKSSTVKPSDEVIKKLYKLYEPHNHALFEFLGHEIKSWSQNT